MHFERVVHQAVEFQGKIQNLGNGTGTPRIVVIFPRGAFAEVHDGKHLVARLDDLIAAEVAEMSEPRHARTTRFRWPVLLR